MNKIMRTKKTEGERKEAIEYLRKLIKPGAKVYVQVKKISRSNMTWYARVFFHTKEDMLCITSRVAAALDWPCKDVDGYWTVKGAGIGTDRAFEIGHHLSYCLHGCSTKDAPTATIKRARKRLDALNAAENAARSACVGCKEYKHHLHTCGDARRAARDESLTKYRAGYSVKGVWL
jgi:hypothetical protein